MLNFSLNFRYELWLSFNKRRMMVVVHVFVAFFGETVHIELSNKGMKVSMFEVDRKNYFGKF